MRPRPPRPLVPILLTVLAAAASAQDSTADAVQRALDALAREERSVADLQARWEGLRAELLTLEREGLELRQRAASVQASLAMLRRDLAARAGQASAQVEAPAVPAPSGKPTSPFAARPSAPTAPPAGGPANPLAGLLQGQGGASPLAGLLKGAGQPGQGNPLAALLGGGGGGGNPLAALMGGGGGGNPMAALMGGGSGPPSGKKALGALRGFLPLLKATGVKLEGVDAEIDALEKDITEVEELEKQIAASRAAGQEPDPELVARAQALADQVNPRLKALNDRIRAGIGR